MDSGATPDTVKKAFEILLSDKEVKTIFINIFGGASSSVVTRVHSVLIYPAGIMRCDYIAEGVIKATKELELTLPLIVRLQGTKEEEAKQYASVILSLTYCLITKFIKVDQGIWSQNICIR